MFLKESVEFVAQKTSGFPTTRFFSFRLHATIFDLKIVVPFSKLSEQDEVIGKAIVHAAYNVHKELGPGLLDKIYETCVTHELRKSGFGVLRQIEIPIQYDGIVFNEGLRLDLLVDNKVIVEIKAVETVNPYWDAQVLSHLKLTRLRLGYLINFNNTLINDGIKRFIL